MDLILKQNILVVIRALYFCMEEQWGQLGKKHNITPAQQHVLFLLMSNKKTMTPSEISELGCWHPSTVTRLLKPMQKKGLITISSDIKRQRFKIVNVTELGETLFRKLVVSVENMDYFPLDMSHLSQTEILQFITYGQTILKNYKGEHFGEKVVNAKIE